MRKLFKIVRALFALLLGITFCFSTTNAQTTYYSKAQATDFNDVNSWGTSTNGGGTSPGSISNADIFVIGNGANLSLSALASVRALYIGNNSGFTPTSAAGTLNVASGDTIIISRPTGNNATLAIGDSGVLSVSGGYLLLNGSFSQTAGGFSQQGGLIAVDGNSGVDSTSVPASTSIFDCSNGTLTLSGGTLMLVDPASPSSATSTIHIAVAGNATGSHTLQLGDGASTDSSKSAKGMVLEIDLFKLKNVIVNNNVSASNNRSASLANSLSLAGDLTILPGSEFRNQSNLSLKLGGNLTNNGKLVTGLSDTLVFEGNVGQKISGSGDFSDSTVSPTANFGSIAFANRSTAGVTFSGTGWHSLPSTVSTSLSFNWGDSTMLNRVHIGNDTFTLGTNLNPGSLVHYQGGFTGGTFRRWMPTAAFLISSTTGRFPFISVASVSKNFSRNLSISLGGLNNSGTFSVSYLDSSGLNLVSPFKDNGSVIEKVSKSSWKVSHQFDTASSGSNLAVRIDGAGIISTPLNLGLRITGATGSALSVGPNDNGTGFLCCPAANKTALTVSELSAGPVSLYFGMDSLIQTAKSGPWQSGSTWVGGVVPGSCQVVAINYGHSITVNSGASSAQDLNILYGGNLSIGGGTLVIGCDTLRNHLIRNSGVLQIISGTLTVNGSIVNEQGNTVNQFGGSIVIDPSDHGNPASSATGSAINFPRGGGYLLSGGNITIVDPTVNGYAVSSSAYTFQAKGSHAFIFGNGVSADTNTNSTGFIIQGDSTSMSLQNVIVNGPSNGNRTVSFSGGFGILGTLTINSGGWLKLPPGAGLSVGGNVNVNTGGTLDGMGANTLSMQRYIAGVASPSGVAQTIGGLGNFYDNASTPSANFHSLKINSGNSYAVTLGPMNSIGSNPNGASISSGLSLKSGKLRMSTGTLIKGSKAAGAGPTAVQSPGSGIAAGTRYAVWYSTSETGSSINAGLDPTSTFKYPFVSFDSLDRSFFIERNSPTSAGLIGVTFIESQSKLLDTDSFPDGSIVLNRHIKSSWSVSVLAGSPGASSFEIAAVSPTTYASVNGANNRLVQTSGVVGTHQSGTGTPGAQRGGLSLSDLTSGTFHIGTDSNNILPRPSIAQQPGNDSVCFGATASFSIVATNATSYQWQKNTATGWVNLSNGNGYSGVSTSSMSIAAADTSMEGNLFRCVAQNSVDTTISNAARLHVIFTPTPTMSAAAEPVKCLGVPIRFIATVTNAGSNPFFQWKTNGVDLGVNDDTLMSLAAKDLDTVVCMFVSNAACVRPDTFSSAPIVMHLQPMVSPFVSIDTPPGPICKGSMVVFTATSMDGGTAPFYRWFINGNQVGSGDTLRSTTLSNHDTIACILASNAACLISAYDTSNNVVITVDSIPAKPSAINGPGSVCSGATNIFSVQADSAAISYTWTLPAGWTGTSDSASIAVTPTATGGTISVTADNACGSSIADTLAVTANAMVAPTVSISAVGGSTICAGTPVNFSYVATDSGSAPSFEWRLNGANVGTTATYSNSSLSNGDSVTLTIISSNTCALPQTVTSPAVHMTVNALPTAPSAAASVIYCQNATAIPLTATGTNLKWYTTSTGGTASTIAPTPVTSSPGTTDHWVSQTNAAGCEGPRTQISVIVNTTPPKPAVSGTTTVCFGDTVFLFGSSSASSPIFNWTGPGGFNSMIQNPVVAPATAASSGVYRLAVTVGSCVSAFDSVTITVSCLDSVWPGDANFDRLVDNTDALEIALAMGSTGPSRSTSSILWRPERCADWATALPSNSSINRKHADCDGDGTIGYSDTLAVNTNYALTHPRGIRSTRKMTAGLPDLYFDLTGITPAAGKTITVPIKLGTASTPVQAIAGMAVRLMIGGIIPSDTPTLSYAGSWLGSSSNTLQFSKAVSNNRVDWAYARTDQQNTSGSGVLAWLTFTLPAGANGQQLKLYFDDVLVVDNAGTEFTEYNTTEDSSIVVPSTGISTNSMRRPEMKVLPNPSTGPCNVELSLPAAGNYTIELRDLSGKLLLQKSDEGKAGLQKISLPTEELTVGMYLISIRCDCGVAQPVRWIKN